MGVIFMTRDEFLKQPDEDHNSMAQKLKRAQLRIMALAKENSELKSKLKTLDKKYCDALRKAGTYKKWLEKTGGIEKEKGYYESIFAFYAQGNKFKRQRVCLHSK